MPFGSNRCILRGEIMLGKREKKPYSKWLETYTKRAVTAILVVCMVDLQLSYLLAFLDKPQIAESLSSTIATVIIGVMVGYFGKALFETFFEKREERLKRKLESQNQTNTEEIEYER